MKYIELTQGKHAIVDDSDFLELSKHNWCYGSGAALRHLSYDKETGKRTHILMHRSIMDAPDGVQVDHINHIRLDNRRFNLRICNNQENHWNLLPRGGNSKYKGVNLPTGRKKWCAKIRIKGKQTFLGNFSKEIDAADAYDFAALKHFGEFACINSPINRHLANI
jgi:hypothetical protein